MVWIGIRRCLSRRGTAWVLFGSLAIVSACSEFLGSDQKDPTAGDAGLDGGIPNDNEASGSGGTTVVPVVPPEMELEETFLAPVVSGKSLWTANPDTNKVARIFADSLEIEVLEAGHAPTYLASLPAGATEGGALVLNELSQDASIFLQDKEGQVASVRRVPVQEGASGWSVGRAGKRAIAWSRADVALLESGDGYQDLTVFAFDGDQVDTTELSVGFRPSRVFINDSEDHAYVISDPGISVIRLGSDADIEREIFLPSDDGALGRDVTITPDGSLAYVRVEGAREVLLVETASGDQVTVELPGIVTDLDLSANGRRAFAVVRGAPADEASMGGAGGALEPNHSLLVRLDTDSIFEKQDEFESYPIDDIVGSVVVGPKGKRVLLFSNAVANPRLHIFDADDETSRAVDLKAPIIAAFLADSAEFAVALMAPPAGSSKAGAFALVPVSDELPARIEGTDQPPEFVTLSNDPDRALITTRAGVDDRAQTFFAHFPTLSVDRVPLPSRPLASGVVPEAGRAFVTQAHPEGRVTFVDLDSGDETTLTGFELGSKVVR